MKEILEQFNIWSAIDIILISVLVYQGLLLLKGSRAAQMLVGLVVMLGLFFVSSKFPLTTLNWLISKFSSSVVIIVVVIFQDDIRRVLSSVGRHYFWNSGDTFASEGVIDEIAKASFVLASKKQGGLIVFERNIELKRHTEAGTWINGEISKDLILSLFNPASPLHDGAVIIRKQKIEYAGSFLPLAQDVSLDSQFGTRHRAALGICRETDALAVIISEQTGTVRIVEDMDLSTPLDIDELKVVLKKLLQSQAPEEQKPKPNIVNFLKKISSRVK